MLRTSGLTESESGGTAGGVICWLEDPSAALALALREGMAPIVSRAQSVQGRRRDLDIYLYVISDEV